MTLTKKQTEEGLCRVTITLTQEYDRAKKRCQEHIGIALTHGQFVEFLTRYYTKHEGLGSVKTEWRIPWRPGHADRKEQDAC